MTSDSIFEGYGSLCFRLGHNNPALSIPSKTLGSSATVSVLQPAHNLTFKNIVHIPSSRFLFAAGKVQSRAASPPVEELLREFAQPEPLHAPEPQRPPPVDTSRPAQTSEPWTRSPTRASIQAAENWSLRARPGSQVLSPTPASGMERLAQSAAAGPSGRGFARGNFRSELKPKERWHTFEQGQFMALKAIEVSGLSEDAETQCCVLIRMLRGHSCPIGGKALSRVNQAGCLDDCEYSRFLAS